MSRAVFSQLLIMARNTRRTRRGRTACDRRILRLGCVVPPYPAVMRTPSLDQLDYSILRRLQRDARTIAESIAAEVGMSTAAVQRRIKRLRETGVIRREVAVLNPKALGLAMTFIVEVEMERERSDVLDAFRYQMDADENVQQCYYVTGAYDFILIVTARDMEDFEEFTQRTFFDNPNVRRFSTSIVMRPIKVGLTLPLSTQA